MSGFQVMAEQCDQCLLSPDRIVSKSRASQILKDCAREDRHFVCHKATLAGVDACCRAFFDIDPYASNLMRIAHRLGMVREWSP